MYLSMLYLNNLLLHLLKFTTRNSNMIQVNDRNKLSIKTGCPGNEQLNIPT